jgi:CubicO group peptidase (beta-lactamase class C family)
MVQCVAQDCIDYKTVPVNVTSPGVLRDVTSAAVTIERAAVLDACAYLDEWLRFRVSFDRLPGLQAAVLHGGDVVLSTAHGLADVEAGTALTAEHRFRIASHSKTFTATAVVDLAEQGVLRLDDTVGHWLAELASSGVGGVTLRELLAHGAGVIRDGWDGDHWQLVRAFPDASALRRIATDEAAVLGRNERFKYSNIGYSLLGAVIEAATATSYAEHVRSALLEPLGLAATSPDVDTAAATDHATGYTALAYSDRRLPIDHIATGAMAAATGFSSTATDLVRWAAAHFHGDERILTDEAKRLMQRTEWPVEGGDDYALGFAVAEIGGRRVLGHGGGFPGFITQTWFDPVDRLAVAVLTNAIDGPALTLANLAVRLVGLAQDGLDGAEPAVEDPSRYTGMFTSLWGRRDIVALGGRLYGLNPTLADPVPTMDRLAIVDADTLRIADGPGYGSPGERVEYERDATGIAVAIRGGSGTTARRDETFRASLAQRDRIRLGQG